jgi:hypothetical protein
MKGLNLNSNLLASKQIHEDLEIITIRYIFHHYTEIDSLEKDFTKEANALATRDIVIRLQQKVVVGSESLIVTLDEASSQSAMPQEQDFE